MHWRTPFPPKHPSLIAEMIAVLRGSFDPERVIAPPAEALPDELPARSDTEAEALPIGHS